MKNRHYAVDLIIFYMGVRTYGYSIVRYKTGIGQYRKNYKIKYMNEQLVDKKNIT